MPSLSRSPDPPRTADPPTDEQRDLLARLASVAEMIEQHRATIYLLERERVQLQHRLRLTGLRPAAPAADLP
ncbi:MAG: hypothetical protein V9E93_19560 [Steroidobacteraceae bacterium]|nr:hypothetical protein [Pseudomonadota bacterium]MBP6106734.1 hypothetical protein [Steroidobacteraceae bacterium]MBP7013163.1 hypothetical protein [Steroidobacteraceae bacterium]